MIILEETDNRFYVDYSTIPNANKGLFAKEKISKGETIEIIGVYVKRRGATDICIEYTSRQRYIFKDFYVVPIGFAAMINFTPYKEKENVICVGTDRAYLEITQDVQPDQEIFLYGGQAIEEMLKNQNELQNNIEIEESIFFLDNFKKLSFLLNE